MPDAAPVSADTSGQRSFAPVWLTGLTNSVFGMYGGIVAVSMPQLLSARQVPETTIAAMTAVMMSPGFWTFLVSPVLDVRFSRRWYAVVTAVLAAVLLMLALINIDNLPLVEILILVGFFSANLYQSALGGWLATITTKESEAKLSTWVTIGNIGAGGAMAALTGQLMQRLPTIPAAILIATLIVLPLAVFPWIRSPPADRRLARESFAQFFREVLGLLKQRQVLIAIVLFITPTATFSLTNFLSGIGRDFHAAPSLVALIGGAGVLAGGLAGCFCFQLIARLWPLRMLYLGIAVAGSLFTLALLLWARTPTLFAVALIGENLFQALAITAMVAIAFDTIGRGNPLAATTYCLMVSAANVPITYMVLVDGWGYTQSGVAGSFRIDAALGLLSAAALGALLLWHARPKSGLRAARAR
jgi:MFS transporter, PAT family, beta-lactamase induction signal transducer AmpG